MASMNLDEKANFTRLSRLLVDKGTEALRNTLDSLHPSANLPAVLNANRTSLLKLKPRVINDTQWDLLFPPSGNPPNSKTFDVTLLTVLLRNICGLPPPATGWNTMPPDTDRSPQANVTRIKLLRNQIYAHVSSTEVDKAAFENLWQKVTEALVDLKIPQKEIDDLKTCPLGPEEENYVQTLKEWVLKEDDCKNILDDLTTNVKLIQQQLIQSDRQRQNDMQQLTTNVTAEIRQGIQQLCPSSSMESKVESQIFDSKESKVGQEHTSNMEEQLLQKLAKHNFKSKIRSKVRLFYPGTREWLLRKLDNWFTTDDESRLLLVTGGPGFGKSVFAAKVCELFNEKGKLAACHFCDFNDSNLKDPMMMLQSLASHMSENVPGFKEKLLDQLNRPHKVRSLKDAFQIYLQNPLDELDVEPRLIVIDGLDESATADKSDMMKLIADYFPDLPKCVKVLVTSRPELSLQIFDHIQIIEVDPKHLDNEDDLLKYLEDCFQARHRFFNSIQTVIVEKCEGSFLYAFHFQHELRKRADLDTITVEQVVDFLPEGMGSIYNAYFRRLEIELEATMNKKPDLFKVLELLVAASKPLPLKFLARALDLDPDCREMRRIINKVNEALSCLLYVSNDVVTVFHKSMYDWLLANGYEDHEYSVKIHDGKKRLWQMCEQIFEEIKRNVTSEQVKPTNEVMHALEYGHQYLLACDIKNNFYWLVDMIIVHVLSTVHPKSICHLQTKWEKVLQSDVTISLQLRQRISWHFIEIANIKIKGQIYPSCSYLKSVLNHSPEGCFTDDERKIAEEILAKFHLCVKRDLVEMKSMKPFLATFFQSPIIAVGVSSIKKLAAVALKDGTICVLSLPELVKLFQYSTGYNSISCCTFSPDDSLVLYGKLGTALSIVEKKEVSFFSGKVERFKSCSFSPKGKRLVTNDGSSKVKLWDVARQSLLSILCAAGVPLKCCSFNETGLFIIAYRKNAIPVEDCYCVWNAITFQRVDLRSLSSYKLKKKDGLRSSETCKRCFGQAHKELIPWKGLGSSTGIYNDVDCIFYLDGQTLHVMESIHLTTLAIWGIFIEYFKCCLFFVGITAIKDDLWLYGDKHNLIVYMTVPPKGNQSCLSRPTLVLWCSFSPDGTRLASCTSDGFIDLWYVDTSQIYQHFRSNIGTLSAACWWSEKYLFVCHINEDIPSLSLYPVDENFNIFTTEMLPTSLFSLVNEFLPFSGILDFSEGYISFGCGEIKPVKVIDVNKMDYPKIIFLPGIEPMMNIAVSTGASLILGTDGSNLTIWKRNDAVPAAYDILTVNSLQNPLYSAGGCCFSEDSKFVVSFLPNLLTLTFTDVDTNVCVTEVIRDGYGTDVGETEEIQGVFLPKRGNVTPQVFSTNRVIILVTSNFINIFDRKSRTFLGSSFHWHLAANSVIHSKLSPRGNILAVPGLTGDVDFLKICHSEHS